MIPVEDHFRTVDIELVFCFLRPWKGNEPFNVVADDGAFSRARRHLFIARKLLQSSRFNIFRHACFFDLHRKVFHFAGLAFLITELLLDCLHLLAQIVFLLSAFHGAFDALADLFLQ